MAIAAAPERTRRTARFGPFEFDSHTAELRKHGVRVRLQGQPMQLLAALLENPGDVVLRTDLQRRLWPAETFVDFDNGLNSAAKRLRAALADSADSPVYIETLARTGYRFIAPVRFGEQEAAAAPPAPTRRNLWPLAILPAVGGPAAWYAMRSEPPATFRQVTFRRGPLFGAAFAPDGQSVVFAAQYGLQPRQIYVNNGVSPEARALGLAGYSLFAVSKRGELALYQYGGTMPTSGGNLVKVPMNGGAPVTVEKNVMSAGWSPDGAQFALVKVEGGKSTLEYPPGKPLYTTAGWISSVAVHPEGDRVAFIDHPVRHDDAGAVKLVDRTGRVVELTGSWPSTGGAEWHPNGELWFAAAGGNSPRSLWAVREGRKPRSVAHFPGAVSLRDISVRGVVLLSRDQRRLETYALTAGGGEEDLSWLDWTRAVDVTDDGRVLFDESGEAVAARSATFVRKVGDAEAARIADGQVALGFTPGGTGALTLSQDDRKQLHIYPLGGGARLDVPPNGLEYQWARFFPSGRQLLALAGQPLRLHRVDAATGAAQPIAEPGMVRYAAISPTGDRVAYLTASGRLLEYSPDDETKTLADSEPLAPVHYSADGRRLYLQHVRASGLPSKLSVLDLAAGRITAWRDVSPRDPVGIDLVTRVLLSPDGKTMLYSVRRIQSELFTASNLR